MWVRSKPPYMGCRDCSWSSLGQDRRGIGPPEWILSPHWRLEILTYLFFWVTGKLCTHYRVFSDYAWFTAQGGSSKIPSDPNYAYLIYKRWTLVLLIMLPSR